MNNVESSCDNWKPFVRLLCELGVNNSSKDIADVINKNTQYSVRWTQVAGIKSHYARQKNK